MGETLSLVPTLVEIVIFVAGVVWTFSRVRASINVAITHLRIDMLKRHADSVISMAELRERVTVIESRVNDLWEDWKRGNGGQS